MANRDCHVRQWGLVVGLLLGGFCLASGSSAFCGETTPERAQNRYPPEAQRAGGPQRLGSLHLAVDKTTVIEGEDVDVTLTLRSEVPTVAVLPSPSGEYLGFRIARLDGDKSKVIYESHVRKEKHQYAGDPFTLTSKSERKFHIMLLSESSNWLGPGTYTVEVTYQPQFLSAQFKTAQWWDVMLAAEKIRLTVRPAPKDREPVHSAVKGFVTRERENFDGPKTFIARYKKVLAMHPSAPLEKRVRWRFIRGLMRKSFKPEYKAILLKELEGLAAMDLTPGEKAQVFTKLGEYYYLEKKDLENAKAVLSQVNTVRAQFLLQSIREQQKPK